MARPKKTGIEYFPFDIDMFEDEKVLPVSVEFGAKGESVVVRVLCAIYREGYFVQWSEGLKFKIANQAKVSEGLVSDVVAKLVKYHFFNEGIFNQHQVITSAGIQKRWKEATRKRVDPDEKEFWLLEKNEVSGGRNDVSGGRKAEETPTKRPETPQSKVKEKKLITPLPPTGDEQELPPVWKKDYQVYLSDLRSAFKKLIADQDWISQQEKFNPGVDIQKSIEKSCVNYWATEGGWKKKKASKIKSIDWKSTFANAISQSMNRVYKDRFGAEPKENVKLQKPEKW